MGSSESTPAAAPIDPMQIVDPRTGMTQQQLAQSHKATAALPASPGVHVGGSKTDFKLKHGSDRPEATKHAPQMFIDAEDSQVKHRPADTAFAIERMRTTTDKKLTPEEVAQLPKRERDAFNYTKLRDDLFAFSLGEAAYQYAERLNRESPDNPAVMALLGETAYLYERRKNIARREHWVDRCDVLQRGIDVTRKCMHDNPEYGPCYRAYVLCACKMSDTETFFKRFKPVSLFKHYNRLQAIGDRALELHPSTDVALSLANVAGRCATRLRHWYSPWHPLARWYQLPYQRDILERSKKLLKICVDREPNNVEMACRLAEVLYELGEWNESQRWYKRCRDELNSDDPNQQIWQSVAHTHLTSHFDKPSWNIPFG